MFFFDRECDFELIENCFVSRICFAPTFDCFFDFDLFFFDGFHKNGCWRVGKQGVGMLVVDPFFKVFSGLIFVKQLNLAGGCEIPFFVREG